MKREIVLNDTDIKRALKIMMAESDIDSMAAVARDLNIKETTFRSAINNNSLRVAELVRICEMMGYELVIRSKNQ
ncbi:helix-turn-helix domain-containing protein [Geobacillus stearothermophilus]|uniref:helix-turn-helix domain-containing protein n=1 Tax=Geobacillus stearothermophilus TaxID=1422 RepID=UPI003D1E958A